MENKRILLIGSILLIDDYIRKKHLRPADCEYIKNYEDICGYKDCEIILLNGYYRKEDWFGIEEYCSLHNIKKVRG